MDTVDTNSLKIRSIVMAKQWAVGHYDGEFCHSQYHGKGTLVYDSIGHTYHGEFQNGLNLEYGTEKHTATNTILLQGQWIHGALTTSSSNKVVDDDTLENEEK